MSLTTPDKRKSFIGRLIRFKSSFLHGRFANTGTRFGKFLDPSAAATIEEKLADAAQVNRFTACCPSVAVHVLWDFPKGVESAGPASKQARDLGIRIGSVSPNVFQDQSYKYGSLANPDASIRRKALDHIIDSIEIAKVTGSRDITPWFIDGSNYPGTANMRQHKRWFEEGLREAHAELAPDQRMLVEYKPFEPAFYHTDIADWGMALRLAKAAGSQAKVLVDTGHHYQTQNIEQIVAWLLDDDMLGGFHLNDRRFADDDLTLGSIDPYQVFRIFNEIHALRVGDGPQSRYRLHGGSKPQPEAEDRRNDSDRHHCPGVLRESRRRGSRNAGAVSAILQSDRRGRVPQIGLPDGCPAGARRMAACARSGAVSATGIPRQWLHDARHRRTRRACATGGVIRLKMERVCFLLKVRPERLEEYKARHREVWTEMQQALSETGWGNYSLFLREDGLLVGYLETPDFSQAMDRMAERDINAKWQASMATFFEGLDDKRPDQGMYRLEEIFHLD